MQSIAPLIPGVIYHIYNHGAGTRNPFPDPGHIRRFLDLMDKYIEPVAEMYAWCIMPNHFHLLAAIRENRVYQYKSDDFTQNPEEYREYRWKTVERAGRPQHNDRKGTENREDRAMPIPHLHFSHLFNAYSRYYNTRNESKGVLFERPFRRKRIENEEHLRTAVVYIHNNPVHHGFCKHPGEYPWSSYRSCLSDKPTRIGREKVIGWFGKTEEFISLHTNLININLTGPAGLSGYPSSDGNSISDNNNSNNLTGSANLSGYPSSDGDSASDNNNNNNLTGSANLSGYPSSDGNSASDNNNNNNLTGSVDLSGYPSSDGNSISNNNNNNNLTGPAGLSGYPSSGGDSTSDSINSNNLTGSANLSGYPLSDGDSISDSNNNNNLTGPAGLSGYPSSDGESISDNNSNNKSIKSSPQ